ncbi:ribosome-inactivating family protein [Streptomyces sp. NPDC054863]
MVHRLRDISGRKVVDGVGTTTTTKNQFIAVEVWKGSTHDLTLYFTAHDLYMVGFTSKGYNYRFDESTSTQLESVVRAHYPSNGSRGFTTLGYSGQYGDLKASQSWRGHKDQNFQGATLNGHLSALAGLGSSKPSSDKYGKHMAKIIGATSEAVRFGWIQNRISNTIRGGSENGFDYLGSFGAALEQEWGKLSTLANDLLANGSGEEVKVDGSVYRSLNDFRYGPANSPERRLSILWAKGRG